MKILSFLTSVIMLIWGSGYFWFIHSSKNFVIDNAEKTDVVVVFGESVERLYVGAQLVKLGYAPILYVTGNAPEESYKQFLREQNLQQDQFIFDIEYSSDKKDYGKELALFMRKYRFSSARIVAASTQIKRAIIEAQSNLPKEVLLISNPVSPKNINYNLIFIEYNKFVYIFISSILGLGHEVSLSYS